MDIFNYTRIGDSLALGGQPSEEEITLLAEQGVEKVVNVAPFDTRYSLDNEAKSVANAGMEYLFYPIDFAAPGVEDYLEFEGIMAQLDDAKAFIHCAANFRVSVLYAVYAYRNLGWDKAQCDEFVASVWALEDYPVWQDYYASLLALCDEAGAFLPQLNTLFERYLVQVEGDKFIDQGRRLLERQLMRFIADKQKIQLILPGFPCKSPNIADKSFSQYPDFGEVLAINRLQGFCDRVKRIYPHGVELVILSDGTTFSDLVHVKESVREEYNRRLRELAITHDIRWASLEDLIGKEKYANAQPDKIRKQLVSVINKGNRSFENFVKQVKSNPEQAAVHDRLCSYLYHDICLEQFADGDRDAYLSTIADKAYDMMYRGRALSKRIEETFEHHIRLSVHQYDNAGPKFSFSLSEDISSVKAPWHTVPVLMLEGDFKLLPHSIAKQHQLALVELNDNHWLYLEVPEPALSNFSYEVIKAPRFGLKITDTHQLGYRCFPAAFLKSLSKTFGFLLMPDAQMQAQEELVNFTERLGEIYMWHFGPVHVVKPQEKPDGFVHSIEKTPLHWDLSMLPLDHERVAEDEMFTAETFLLYCKNPPAQGEGQTTLVDSRLALQIAGSDKVERWKNTPVTYETKMTYFGGVPRTYPLVLPHPEDGEDIFRYQEGSDLKIQTFELSSGEMTQTEFDALIRDVNEIAYDPRCFIAHEWKAGDLVMVDNYYTLHGRLPMTQESMGRELWRIQVI